MTDFPNRTRTSSSVAARLVRERRPWLLPLYYSLQLSDLWREGVSGGGSFTFADHIYRSDPSGRALVGRYLDAAILRSPAARAMRNRYLLAVREMVARVRTLARERDGDIHVVSMPCGIARDLRDVALELAEVAPAALDRVRFHGFDLDPVALEKSRRLIERDRVPGRFEWHQGDALALDGQLPESDIVTSHGLADFLPDDRCVELYDRAHGCLRPGGVLITSGMRRYPPLAWALEQLAELRACYRTREDLERVVARSRFAGASMYADDVGLLTMVVAER